MPEGVVLVGGGDVYAADLALARQLAGGLVAADGGADRVLALGAEPDLVIGDLDSISAAARARLRGRVQQVTEQDSTDFGKCLRLVEAPFYLCLGFAGLRLDHTLAALSELAARPEQVVLLLTEQEVVIRLPRRIALRLPAGERVSLFPMGPMRGRSTGLVWPIDDIDFSPAGRVGTSNAVAGAPGTEVLVTLEALAGAALLLLPKRYAVAVLHALQTPRPGA